MIIDCFLIVVIVVVPKRSLNKYVTMLAYEIFPIFATNMEVSKDVRYFVGYESGNAKFVTPAAIRDAVRKLPRTHKLFSSVEYVTKKKNKEKGKERKD